MIPLSARTKNMNVNPKRKLEINQIRDVIDILAFDHKGLHSLKMCVFYACLHTQKVEISVRLNVRYLRINEHMTELSFVYDLMCIS
jgi:hypothetical protein